MKVSMILVILAACQQAEDSSIMQSGGDNSLTAVDIAVENSQTRLEITSDQPLMAGQQGLLRIKFTALQNLSARIVENQNNNGNKDNIKETYQQRPTLSLRFSNPTPDVEYPGHTGNGHIHFGERKTIQLNNMETGNTFTLNYQVTASQSFTIDGSITVEGETKEFTIDGEPIEISVNEVPQDTVDPKDYALVGLGTATLVNGGKIVIVEIRGQDRADELAGVVVTFDGRSNPNLLGQATCQKHGSDDNDLNIEGCGQYTKFSGLSSTNKVTINFPIVLSDNDVEVTVKLVPKELRERPDLAELEAASETLSWSTASAPAKDKKL